MHEPIPVLHIKSWATNVLKCIPRWCIEYVIVDFLDKGSIQMEPTPFRWSPLFLLFAKIPALHVTYFHTDKLVILFLYIAPLCELWTSYNFVLRRIYQ